MKVHVRALFLTALAILAVVAQPAWAQPAAGGRSADGVWQTASDQNLPAAQRRSDLAGPYTVARLDRAALNGVLAAAPNERAANRADISVVLTLPLPDGRFSRFRIEESPILAPELAAAFPDVKTYRGFGIDDPSATARFDLTLNGFHAQVIAAGGTVYIDPYSPGEQVTHVVYDKTSLRRGDDQVPFQDRVLENPNAAAGRTYNSFPITNGTTLRTYRLALAASAAYTTAAGGTKPQAQARMTTTMNRVNGIYERELAVRLTLSTGTVADPTALIYTAAAPGPYTNTSSDIDINRTNVDAVVGSANYDIGHVFTTGSGGVAYLNAVCNATLKGGGTTGRPNPTGDAFDVDYVAHEMGHQFGGNHTFNSNSSSCSGNRSAGHATEVGSGSTIMAYAGICGVEDTQKNSDDIFTFESLNEITAFITSGGGSTCGTTAATGNTVPTLSGPGASFTIPRLTPFALTATGSDPNGDSLTYLWEETDLGTASTSVATATTDDGSRPLFRSYTATASPTRYFPSLGFILNNANVPPTTYSGTNAAGVTCSAGTCLVGETLPNTNRTMVFQVTARDNRAGGGAINTAQTSVTINAATGPFQVTSPNTAVSYAGGSTQTVTWAVNSTNTLAANVAILFSNDGGATFPTALLASTPNDGTETVTIPVGITSTARIKVQAVGNIFFDVSDTNFSVTASGPPPGAFTKSAPANGATGVAANATLTWGASTGATSYEYCIDNSANSTCNSTWVSVASATTAAVNGLTPNTTYSWQVRAVNGVGNTQADGGTWWSFTTANVSNPLGDVLIDFGGSLGLWTYYDGGGSATWQQKHGFNPSKLATGDYDGNGRADIFVNFPGFGLWVLMNDTTWTQLHGVDVTNLVTGDVDGNGRSDVVVSFASYGTWILYDSGTWVQLHPLSASAVAVGNIDSGPGGKAEVILSFGSAGTWVFYNNATWMQLHPLGTVRLVVADVDGNSVGDLVAQFAGYGEYVLLNNTTWVGLHNIQAGDIVAGNLDGDANGRSDIVFYFPGYGIYVYMNNGSWVGLHGFAPSAMATGDVDGNGQADLIVSFPGYGIFIYRNNSTWTGIHNLPAEQLATGRVNAN